MYFRKPSLGAPVSLPSLLSITQFYIQYEQTIILSRASLLALLIKSMYQRRLECIFRDLKYSGQPSKCFRCIQGRNCRWLPLSFENNNIKKRYRAHKFYFIFYSAAQPRPDFSFFLGGKSSSFLTSLDNILWSMRRSYGKSCLFN